LKLFGRDKSKDNDNEEEDNEEEKPIVFYYAKYIGVLGTNKSLPVDEDSYVYIFEDRIDIELLKSKTRVTIPYRSMTDLQNVDAGNKVDLDRVIGLGLVGLLWKRHHVVTIIKYTDDEIPQVIALDFLAGLQYAQPLIDKKFREVHPKLPPKESVISVADELSKLAKLKEQGIITEEEFSQIKNNLIKGSI
jgi:hypothetical protein